MAKEEIGLVIINVYFVYFGMERYKDYDKLIFLQIWSVPCYYVTT